MNQRIRAEIAAAKSRPRKQWRGPKPEYGTNITNAEYKSFKRMEMYFDCQLKDCDTNAFQMSPDIYRVYRADQTRMNLATFGAATKMRKFRAPYVEFVQTTVRFT
jgi:hypothetical protein